MGNKLWRKPSLLMWPVMEGMESQMDCYMRPDSLAAVEHSVL